MLLQVRLSSATTEAHLGHGFLIFVLYIPNIIQYILDNNRYILNSNRYIPDSNMYIRNI